MAPTIVSLRKITRNPVNPYTLPAQGSRRVAFLPCSPECHRVAHMVTRVVALSRVPGTLPLVEHTLAE